MRVACAWHTGANGYRQFKESAQQLACLSSAQPGAGAGAGACEQPGLTIVMLVCSRKREGSQVGAIGRADVTATRMLEHGCIWMICSMSVSIEAKEEEGDEGVSRQDE